MADKEGRMLMDAILDYMGWVKSVENQRGGRSHLRYTRILTDFLIYAIHKGTAWEQIFTFETLEAFQTYSGYKGARPALRALSDYLYSQGKIEQPLQIEKPKPPLPDIYEQYLLYREQSLQVCAGNLSETRRVLAAFHGCLQEHGIALCKVNIEHLDAFMATFQVAQRTRSIYRYHLRGFLKYLYRERRIINKDLAPLLLGPPMFAQQKIPKFLRPEQIRNLFDSLKLSTPAQIRTYATIHLIYSLGLRPVEITRITLDDISFGKGTLVLAQRKADNPVTLPIPRQTLKAVALYVRKARPQSPSRHLFLTLQFPYRPMNPATVVCHISRAMKAAGLPSSAYWLRHTYAQNLLHIGQSIYEVKEMMGHQNIQSTHGYLHINTTLMRKVLFDEEL